MDLCEGHFRALKTKNRSWQGLEEEGSRQRESKCKATKTRRSLVGVWEELKEDWRAWGREKQEVEEEGRVLSQGSFLPAHITGFKGTEAVISGDLLYHYLKRLGLEVGTFVLWVPR